MLAHHGCQAYSSTWWCKEPANEMVRNCGKFPTRPGHHANCGFTGKEKVGQQSPSFLAKNPMYFSWQENKEIRSDFTHYSYYLCPSIDPPCSSPHSHDRLLLGRWKAALGKKWYRLFFGDRHYVYVACRQRPLCALGRLTIDRPTQVWPTAEWDLPPTAPPVLSYA